MTTGLTHFLVRSQCTSGSLQARKYFFSPEDGGGMFLQKAVNFFQATHG
jgi:hypothetical protein